MDDPTKRGPADAARVNVNQDHESRYLCDRWGCTHADLVAAVEAVGPMRKNVEDYLTRLTGRSPGGQ